MNADSKFLRQPSLPKPSWLVKLWAGLLNVGIYAILFGVLARRQQIAFHVLRTGGVSLFGNFWRLAAAVTLILFLTTAVHELGHLVAGKLAGLRFHLLIIGPLRVTRENGKLRFGLHKTAAVFNGITGCTPDDAHNLSRRLLVFTIGGPLASLLQAAGTALIFFRWSSDVHFTNTMAWAVENMAMTAVFAAFFFLSSMKPSRYQSGLPADGGRIISLLHNDPAADRWCALAALNGADLRGRRPRDWDDALVRQALSGYDHTHDARNARFAAYQWALDNGRIAEANRWLEEAITIRPNLLAGTQVRLIWEKAYFTARYLNDPAQARQWLNQVRPKSTDQPQHLRAAAAVLLAEGSREAALSIAKTAMDARLCQSPTGVQKAEMDWLQETIKQG